MPDEDPDFEYSIFCGEFTSEDTTVTVTISRPAGSQAGWTLEVTDRLMIKTIWEHSFPSERHAYEEFLATVDSDGIDTFSQQRPGTLH